MLTRQFGWTGRRVPVIGQGTWHIEGAPAKERRSTEALRLGLDLGLAHIDTAEMYGSGRAEELAGQAIAGRRNEVFLAGKILPHNASYAGTLRACERSLKRLATDWFDLYMLHWESSHPIGETMRAMEKLVAEKMVRYIGVSNFDVGQVRQAQQALRHERLASNQVLYHLGERGIERQLLPYCAEQEIAVVAYSPFNEGNLPSPTTEGGRVLASIGARHGLTPRQVALNFLTRHPAVFTIPKSSNPEHVRENSGGAGCELPAEDLALIDRAFPAPQTDTPLAML
jgi:diketogulonate reductase-like aldo/keto reductase